MDALAEDSALSICGCGICQSGHTGQQQRHFHSVGSVVCNFLLFCSKRKTDVPVLGGDGNLIRGMFADPVLAPERQGDDHIHRFQCRMVDQQQPPNYYDNCVG